MPSARSFPPLLLLLCALPGFAPAADFTLELKGLEGELRSNVEAQLASLGLDSITVRGRYRAGVRTGVRDGLKALGYYEPKLSFVWGPEPKEGSKRPRLLTLTVDPGEPVRIARADLVLKGEAAGDPDFRALLKDLPKKGRVLHHGEYEAFKKRVQSVATKKGYFQGRFTKTELAVAAGLREAWWRLEYDSGRRWHFGPVRFTGSQIDGGILENLVPFRTGDPYASERLAELNENLADTGWFNSAVVAPDFRAVNADMEVPMMGSVTPRSGNIVEMGVGYSTDVGPRFKGEWTKPWVNRRGHSLTLSTSVSAKEQEFDFSYKMPRPASPLEQYYLVQGGWKRTNLNDTDSSQATLVASRYWNLETGWQRAVNLRWMLDSFTQGESTATTMVIYPGVSFNRTRSRGGAMPTWGDSQRYTFDVSRTEWGSDIDFWSFYAQGAMIRTAAARHRFIGRYAFGWIQSTNFKAVPPDLRFFAGGDRSIRGYDYKSISPRDDSGDLRGAERLLTASLEYQWNVKGNWWTAVFVDAGEAVERFTSTSFKAGAGVGIRWQSPVGPVKLDVARPVGDPDHTGFAFYIGLGPEL